MEDAGLRFFSFTVLTRDGADRLRRAGPGRLGGDGPLGPFGSGETRHPVLMRREPGPLPAPDPRITVARTPVELQEAERALAVGLGAPDLRAVLGAGLLDHPLACAYAPDACAVAFDDGTTLGAYLVGTAEPARGEGLGTAVTAAALAALAARPALLTATTQGRPVYERLGFRAMGRATMRLRERSTPRR